MALFSYRNATENCPPRAFGFKSVEAVQKHIAKIQPENPHITFEVVEWIEGHHLNRYFDENQRPYQRRVKTQTKGWKPVKA